MSEAPLGSAGGSTDHVTMVTDPEFKSPLFLKLKTKSFPHLRVVKLKRFH